MNKQELIEYLKEAGLAQSRKTNAVLFMLIDNPDGMLRCCSREYLRSKGFDIGQLAAQVRELRSAGVNIPKVSKVRCETHNVTETKDQIVKPYLDGNAYARAKYTPKEIDAIRNVLGNEDNFTHIKSGSLLEIDHRVPVGRRALGESNAEEKVDVTDDIAIINTYQMLTRENNLYKSRVCEKCVSTNTKPERFMAIRIPLSIGGGKKFEEGKNDCGDCPFAYPENFLSKLVYNED